MSVDKVRSYINKIPTHYKRVKLIRNPARYCRKRLVDPKMFDLKSFRVIPLSEKKGVKGIVGCPKKHFHSGECEMGTKLQSMLYPASHKKCPVPGRELNPKKEGYKDALIRKIVLQSIESGMSLGNVENFVYYLYSMNVRGLEKMYKYMMKGRKKNPGTRYLRNTHLKGNKGDQIKYILDVHSRLGWSHNDLYGLSVFLRDANDKLVYRLYRSAERKAKELNMVEFMRRGGSRKKNPGEKYHTRKFMEYLKGLEKWKIGSLPYVKDLAKAYEHLESANESAREGIE